MDERERKLMERFEGLVESVRIDMEKLIGEVSSMRVLLFGGTDSDKRPLKIQMEDQARELAALKDTASKNDETISDLQKEVTELKKVNEDQDKEIKALKEAQEKNRKEIETLKDSITSEAGERAVQKYQFGILEKAAIGALGIILSGILIALLALVFK